MLRFPSIIAAALTILALWAGDACAQEANRWVAFPIQSGWRGPGFYLSWIKILAVWLVFLSWVATTDWVSRDLREKKKLDYRIWNPIVFGSFLAAFFLLLLIPAFWAGFPLLLLGYGGSLGAYIFLRNQKCEQDQRVLTPEHLRFWFATQLNRFGGKMAVEKPNPLDAGPPVQCLGFGCEKPADNAARTAAARLNPGIPHARQIIADAVDCRASAVMLDTLRESVVLRYMVDGVWVNRDPETRDRAGPAIEALKILCGLKPEDHTSRQEGKFKAEYKDAKLIGTLTTVGIQTGERALLQFEEKHIRIAGFDQLGMRDKMRDQLKELLEQPKGLVIFSALPSGGLRSTVDVALRGMDRLMRDFVTVEDEDKPYEPVENVPVTTYKAAAGETPDTVLPKLARREPNVFVVRDLVNGKTLEFLCGQVFSDHMVVSTMRAKDCADALLRVLALGAPPEDLAKAALVVVNQRLVRTLCEKCKEAYTPAPETLQQIGVPEGRVKALYRPPERKLAPGADKKKEEICAECGGIGYKGRTAIFELLAVGETTRRALISSPKADLLRSAARKDGMRGLQEEAVLLVIKGVTSLNEVMRVLKQ